MGAQAWGTALILKYGMDTVSLFLLLLLLSSFIKKKYLLSAYYGLVLRHN